MQNVGKSKLGCWSECTKKPSYWLLLIIFGLSLEGVALYYQYVLNYGPCVLCIHIRIGIFAWILAAMLGFFLRLQRPGRQIAHILGLAAMLVTLERAWQTLGVERGWTVGSCSMESGLPAWFALDQWLPSVFQPWEPCGYTPILGFSVTMAEALVLMSGLISLWGLCILILELRFKH